MTDTSITTYVFDLDGVIYRGDEPLPNASETLSELRRRGRNIFFLTNNATQSRRKYKDKLAAMNIFSNAEEMMTSAHATALYLTEQNAAGKRAYVIGEYGLTDELEAIGVEVSQNGCKGNIDYVVVGLDRKFNYDKLNHAQQAILSGAAFIATNRDLTLPLEAGSVAPGGGSIVCAVEAASGVSPLTIGKPEVYSLAKIIELAGSAPNETVMIGDRPETDILVGNRVGTHTTLITTGVTDADEAGLLPDDMKPGRVIHDLIELLDENYGDI